MNGVHCCCVIVNGVMVLNWESDGRNTTVVCNLEGSDLAEIIRTLLGYE